MWAPHTQPVLGYMTEELPGQATCPGNTVGDPHARHETRCKSWLHSRHVGDGRGCRVLRYQGGATLKMRLTQMMTNASGQALRIFLWSRLHHQNFSLLAPPSVICSKAQLREPGISVQLKLYLTLRLLGQSVSNPCFPDSTSTTHRQELAPLNPVHPPGVELSCLHSPLVSVRQ